MASPLPVVQFSSQIMYSNEGNTKTIEVMRIGAMQETCVVSYDALDKSLEGVKFEKCSGTLEFGPNETTKSFTIRLIEEKMFDSVVELSFVLEPVKNCEVGAYLNRTRVKIIDDDVFPSPLFESEIKADPSCDSWKAGNDFRMLKEFAKLCYSINTPGARWLLMGDQIANVIFIGQVEVGKRLINALSLEDNDFHNSEGILFLAILLTAPYAFTHLFTYRKQFWKVGGMIRKEMLKDLMMRCLYYEEATRDEVNSMEFKQTFSQHVFKLVSDGYMKFFELAAAMGRVIMLFLYFLIYAVKSIAEGDGGQLFYFVALFAAVPILAYVYMLIRTKKSTQVREETEDAKVELMSYMDAVNDDYRIVADCWARPLVIKEVLNKINLVNKYLVDQGARTANDMAFFGWAQELVEFFVIIVAGNLHIHGEITLGVFTSTMAGLRGASAQYGRMYKAFLSMQSCYPALWLLVQYMNLPMDLDQRLATMDKSRKLWPERLAMAQKHEDVVSGKANAEDVMPIMLTDVEFEYKVTLRQKLGPRAPGSVADTAESSDYRVLRQVNLEVQQGTLIGVSGPPGHGKGTLLRVLSEVLPPTKGQVFVPSHLRVHHCQVQENLYEGSVAFNVFFALLASKGLTKVEELSKEERDRGVRVCKALDMMPKIVESVEKHDAHTGTKLKGLSLTTRIRIQVARALIANPEVLVLHMPVDSLREAQGDRVIKQLVEFVRNKGVELEPDNCGRRRPRTCLFTSNHAYFLQQADKVWSVVEGSMHEKLLLEPTSARGRASNLEGSSGPPIEELRLGARSPSLEDKTTGAAVPAEAGGAAEEALLPGAPDGSS